VVFGYGGTVSSEPGAWAEHASELLGRPRPAASRPIPTFVWLQTRAAAHALLGEFSECEPLLVEHAQRLAALLESGLETLPEEGQQFDRSFDVLLPLRFGAQWAIARSDRAAADRLLERWLLPTIAHFDDSAIVLGAWQSLSLFVRADDEVVRMDDEEGQELRGIGDGSFAPLLALARGDSEIFLAFVASETLRVEDTLRRPPSRGALFALDTASDVLGLRTAGYARLAMQRGLHPPAQWSGRIARWSKGGAP
jgi:hypothetical protein